MSTVVDNRVVSMEFDNSKFEKNVEESLGTLKKLSTSLDSLGEGSSAGLEKLMSALGNLSFDRLADGVDTIIGKFSLFGQIGTKMVGAVADAVVDLARKFKDTVDSLTVDQVAEGWDKYAQKTTAVQTIMNATGDSIEEVSAQLDKLMWFTDETSYDFSDMANSIGKFTSNGQSLERSVIAMEGISNWAALSGQSAQQASIAMYNLSQALSAGAVKAADWRSIELANMATQSFKETVLETAVECGTLKKVSEGVYETIAKEGKEAEQVTASTFRSMLDKGFFTSEVLMSTLQKYGNFTEALNKSCEETGLSATDLLAATNSLIDGTKTAKDIYEEYADDLDSAGVSADRLQEILAELSSEEYELGRKAFAAGQEAKTFADALNAVKDAASSAWLRIFENIFGNYEEAKSLWTTMANDLYEIFVGDIDVINDALSGATTSAWDTLTAAIEEAGVSVSDFETAMSKTAKEAGYDIDSLIDKYGSLGAVLKSGEFGSWLNNNKSMITKALESLGLSDTITEDVIQNGEKVEKTAQELHDVVVRDWYGKFGTGEEREAAIRALGFDPDVVAELAKEWEASNPGDKDHRMVFYDQAYADRAALSANTITQATNETAKSYENLQELIDSSDFSQVNFRQMIALGITSSLESVINTMSLFRNAWNDLFHNGLSDEEITEERSNRLREFSARFANFATIIKDFTEEISGDSTNVIFRAVEGIIAIGEGVWNVYSSLFAFVSPVLTVIGALATPIIGILAKIGDWSVALKTALGGLNPIKSIATSIADSLNTILGLFGKFGSGIYSRLFQNESDSAETFEEKVGKVAEKIQTLTEKFENFKKRLEDAKTLKEAYDIIATEVSERITKVKNSFNEFFSSITKANFETKKEEIKTSIKSTINTIGKTILAEWYGLDVEDELVNETWTKIKNKIRNFPDTIKTAIEDFSLSSVKTTIANTIRNFGKTFIAQWLGLERDSQEVSDIWSSIEYKIRHPIESFKKYIENLDAKEAFETFKNTIRTKYNSIKTYFESISWSDIWTGFKESLSNGVIGIGSFIRTAFGYVKSFFSAALDDVKNHFEIYTWTDLGNAIIAKGKTIVSSIKEFLVNSAKGIFSTILKAFGKSDEESNQITEAVFGTIRNAFTNVRTTLEGFAGDSSLSGIVSEMALAVIDFFTNLGTNIASAIRSVASWADSGLGTVLTSIGNFFSSIWTFLSNLSLESILEFLEKFSSTIKAGAILIVTIGLRLALIVKRLQSAKAINEIATAVKKIGKSIAGIGDGIKSIEKAKAFKIKVEAISSLGGMLLKMAAAIAVVVAAIWALGKMADDPAFDSGFEKLGSIVTTMVGIVVIIEGVQFAFAALSKVFKITNYEPAFSKMGVSMLAMAAAIILMIAAIKIIANTHFGLQDGATLLKTIGVLTLIVAALAGLSMAAGKYGNISTGTGVAMIAMAAAVIVMVKAFKKIAELDLSWSKDSLTKIIAFAAVVGALGLLAVAANKFEFGIGQALAFVVMAAAISIVASAMKKLCEVPFSYNETMLLGMVTVLSVIVAFFGEKDNFTNGLKGAVVLLAIALEIVAIGHALKMVSDLPDVTNVIVNIAEALLVLATFSYISGTAWTTMLKGSVAIAAMAAALVVMGYALKLIADLGDATTTIVSIGEALLVMAAAGFVMGSAWQVFLIGAGVMAAFGIALGVFGVAVGLAASGMADLGAACEPFANGLQALTKIDMATLAGGLAKLAATFITLGLATATMTVNSGAKFSSMTDGLVSFCENFDTIATGLEKLGTIGKNGDKQVYEIDDALTNLTEIFAKIRDATISAAITDFINGDNNDRLSKAASSLVEFNTHVGEIQNALEVLGGEAFSNVDSAMDSLKTLVSGIYTAESEAYGSDFSDFKAMSDNLSGFGDNLDSIKTVIESLASYGTEENKTAIQNAIDILGLIIGSSDTALFSDNSTGLVHVLESAGSTDFSNLTKMADGLASFEKVGPAVESLKSLEGLNVEEALKPIVDIFGSEGIVTGLLNATYDFDNLTIMSESLASFVDSFSKIPDISSTVLTDLIGRTDEFTETGTKLLQAFLDGLDPNAEGNTVETTKLITIILDEFNNHIDDWKAAGSDAAAAFVAGISEDSDSIIESINTILSGVSTSGLSLGEVSVDSDSLSGSGGISDLLTSMLGNLSGENLLGGKSITDLLGIDSLTGAIDIGSLFTGLNGKNGTFDMSSILDMDSLKESLNIEEMFGLSEGGTFDMSSILDIDSLKESLNIEEMFGLSEGGTYDISQLIDTESLTGSIDPNTLFDGISTEEKLDLSDYVDTDSLTSSLNSAISSAVDGMSSSESEIKTAAESLISAAIAAIEGTAGEWKSAGQFVITYCISGIKSASSNMTQACKTMMSNGITAVTGTSAGWRSAGQYLGLVLSNGISSIYDTVMTAGTNLGNAGASGAKATQGTWQSTGTYLALGLARGISAGQKYVSTAAKNLANSANTSAREALSIRSPSRVFMEIGEYMAQGMAIGIAHDQGSVETASENLANSAISAVTTAQELISSILETDTQPTIRPVLDLSEVESQAKQIDSMIGYSSLGVSSLASRAGSLSSSIDIAKAKIQNASNQTLTATLDATSLQAILANTNKPIQVNTNIAYEGSLAQLATVLHPYIKNEANRIGPSFVNSNR